MWLEVSPQQILQDSRLIVEAELVEIFETDVQKQTLLLGLLQIKKVHKGQINQFLVPMQLPRSISGYMNSADIHYKKGTSGLWLLTLNKNGLLSANHPQRFISMDKARPILDILEQQAK